MCVAAVLVAQLRLQCVSMLRRKQPDHVRVLTQRLCCWHDMMPALLLPQCITYTWQRARYTWLRLLLHSSASSRLWSCLMPCSASSSAAEPAARAAAAWKSVLRQTQHVTLAYLHGGYALGRQPSWFCDVVYCTVMSAMLLRRLSEHLATVDVHWMPR
jgi:hypothetical protein